MPLAPVRRGVSLSDKWTVNDAARMSPNRCGSSLDCRGRNPRALLFTAAVSFGHPCDAKIVNSRLAVVKEIRMDLGEAAMSEKTNWWVLPPTSSDHWDRRRPIGSRLLAGEDLSGSIIFVRRTVPPQGGASHSIEEFDPGSD